MKIGDKVLITDTEMKNLYGIKDTDEFEIIYLYYSDNKVCNVVLTNNWRLTPKYVKEVCNG